MLQKQSSFLAMQGNQQFHTQFNIKNGPTNESILSKKTELPICFRGIILLQVWKNTHQRKSNLQQCQFSSAQQKLFAQKRQKQEFLIRWKFACCKHKIIHQTINHVLCQQVISKNSFFYRLKKLIEDQKQRQLNLSQIQFVTQKIDLNQKAESQIIQVKPVLKDAEINTAQILENPQIYEVQKELFQNKPNERKKTKIRIKMTMKDDLIQRIETQMSQKFQKLDKIIHKVNEIHNFPK